MVRQIHTKATAKAAAGPAPEGQIDSFVDVLLKLLPAEVVAAYLTIQGITGTAPSGSNATAGAAPVIGQDGILLIACSIVLFLATPLYLWKVQKVTLRSQLIITTLSFAVWLFAIGGPFTYLSIDQTFREHLSAVLLVVFVFLLPIVYKR